MAADRKIEWTSELGSLADPRQHTGALDLGECDKVTALRYLRDMLLIRLAEQQVALFVDEGKAKAPCHLGIGQEAVAVGVSAALRPTDRVFGGHRSHAHYLALGGDLYRMLAEILGKADGASHGMGGSMHLLAREVGFHGSVPLVGATIPIAVGAALAAKMDGGTDIAVGYFGDGAAEEGVFHESLNLASVFSLPVLFVCENNLFSSHLDITLRQPSDRVARYAEAHKVLSHTVDGNDVLAVARVATELVAHARARRGPAMLESVTYRHLGHVGPKEDIDVGVRRQREDVEAWKKRDPVRRLQQAILDAGWAKTNEFDAMQAALRDEVTDCARRAVHAGYPPLSALLDLVYASRER